MDGSLISRAAENLRTAKPTKVCPECGAMMFAGCGELVHTATCPIWREEQFKKIARFAGLPIENRRTFANFRKIDGSGKALAAAKLFCDPEHRKHHFITLSGEPGRGKTHLGQAIGWDWIERYFTMKLRYCQAERMLDDLRRCYDRRGEGVENNFDLALNLLCKIPLLILDDYGTENSTDWTRAKLQEIIDERYEAGRMTVVTTNLRPSQMPARILSRLTEGVYVILEGEDYRQIKAVSR